MRSLLPTIAFLLLTAALSAQEVHAFYDLFDDSLTFQRDGKAVKKPRLRRGDRVVVHFTEFNPYLFTASSEVVTETDPSALSPTDGFAGASPLAMLMPGMMGTMPGVSAFLTGGDTSKHPLAFMDKPLLSLGAASFRLNDLFSKEQSRSDLDLPAVQAQLADLARIQTEMQQVVGELEEARLSSIAAQMAAPFFEDVAHRPDLRPSLIKKMGMEYASLIYPGKSVAELEVRDAFAWQSRAARRAQLLGEFESLQKEYAQKSASMDITARQMANLDLRMEAFEKFTADLTALGKRNSDFQKQATRFLAAERADPASAGMTLAEVVAMQVRLRELASQSFTYETVVNLEAETTILSTTFTPIDSMGKAAATSSGPSGKTKTIRFETAGGMRFTSGLGLAFGGFGGASEDFSVRNGAIVAEEDSPFTPLLASFAHIYPRKKGRMAIGGSFGVGIPLGGGSVQMPHFFFGPSLFFGSGQRLSLTGGLMLGPVRKLAKGYAVGDAFDLNVAGELPTRSRYERGWFAGFSFNLVR